MTTQADAPSESLEPVSQGTEHAGEATEQAGQPTEPASDEVERAAKRSAWRASPERRQGVRLTVWLACALGALGLGLGSAIGWFTYVENSGSLFSRGGQTILAGVAGLVCGLGIATGFGQASVAIRMRAFHDRYLVQQARGLLDQAEADVLQSTDDTSFNALWVATQKRLDYYHEIATTQSQRSFMYGQAAAGTGFLLVLVCTVLAIVSSSTAGAVAAGVLGGSGAAMAGYIGSTFLRTQDIAAQQLRAYFNQPLESSRYLSAERLLAEIDDPARREAAASALIHAIATYSGGADVEA